MEKFIRSLYADMDAELQKVTFDAANNLQKAEGAYYVIEASLQKLKDFILGYEFKNEEEEIRFFKEIKPGLLKELIYFIEVYHIESNKPVGERKALRHYFNSELVRVRLVFERNQFLYNYYRTGRTNYDRAFFTRNSDEKVLSPGYALDTDYRFSSVNSSNLAQLIAFEQLSTFLQQQLEQLENPLPPQAVAEGKRYRNVWTESKAALIELAYAIHARGAVNNGKGDVKQIIEDLQEFFNVQLGNFYRVYQGMRIRKKNRTSFLDNLKDSLERRMDEADENY